MAMKPVNIAARRLRDLHSIKRAVVAVTEKAKSEGRCNIGQMIWRQERQVYILEVENCGLLADDIAECVNSSDFAQLESTDELPGYYMWAEDKYIRPKSVVKFIFP